MLKVLLSALSIFVLAGSTLPVPALANRCPVRDPTTLLSLYRNSEFIYLGTFDKIEYGESTAETDDYTVVSLKKYFTISSTLKGESRKFVVLDDLEYQFKNQEPEPIAENDANGDETVSEAESARDDSDATAGDEVAEGEDVEVLMNGTPYRPLKPGDPVLLFLDRVAEEDANSEVHPDQTAGNTSSTDTVKRDRLELSDEPYGLKNLSADSLAAYEARIKELNGIFGAKEPSYAQIVAWLIRCAEDPLTRWEGTFELAASYRALEWEKERMQEKEEGQEEESAETPHAPEKFFTGDAGFAKALTDAHKQALTDLLLGLGSSDDPMSPPAPIRATRGDTELIDLVRRWGDSTVAAGLFEKLQAQAGGDLSADLMTTISSILDNEELSAIWDRYSEIQWEDGAALVEEKKESGDPPVDQQAVAGPAIDSVAPVAGEGANTSKIADADDKTDMLESEAVVSPPKKRTYAEARTELLDQFKSLATELLSKEREKKTAKVNP